MKGEPLLQIDQLTMCVPGLSRHEAELLGRNVVTRLSERLPDGIKASRWSELDLRLRLPADTSADAMCDVIVDKLLQSVMK